MSEDTGSKRGPLRRYNRTALSPEWIQATCFNRSDYLLLLFITIVTIAVRFYKLDNPRAIVFDELHFGDYVRQYLLGTFHLDVHPPLWKLVYSWVARFGGYEGHYYFNEVGDVYGDDVPFVMMRAISSTCGVLSVIIAYATLRKCGCVTIVATFGSLLVAIENSLVTQSRLIMLDSPVVLGAALAVYGVKSSQTFDPFTRRWLQSLVVTGMGLGLAVGTKLSGLFTVGWVAIVTAMHLWQYFGDLDVSTSVIVRHIGARAATMLLIPVTMYLAAFSVHFAALSKPGGGIGKITPEFKATIDPSILDSPSKVSYGSTVTIKHLSLGSYLHSHSYNYQNDGSSGFQQVTNYDFDPDPNNEWIIEGSHYTREGELQKKVNAVHDNSIVRLYHKGTGRYLHISDVKPPTSEHDYAKEVNCNETRGLLGNGDYEFRLRIIKTRTNNPSARVAIKAGETVFQIVPRNFGCVLVGHTQKLPRWGGMQKGVVCIEEPTVAGTLWYVERNSHPLIDNDIEEPRVNLPSGNFWHRVIQAHQAMFQINAEFTEAHSASQAPDRWPWATVGASYYLAVNSQTFLLGNIVIYLVGIFVIALIVAKILFYTAMSLNPFIDIYIPEYARRFHHTSFELCLGWAMHYLPYFRLGRALFIHHYLPSVYFAILAIALYTNYQVVKRPITGYFIMVTVGLGALYVFFTFSPLIYGTIWTEEACEAARWLPTWQFKCQVYVPTL
ncbi:dolichyl-phosphate-mannose--protein mannosyltransferase 5 [Diutina catenulata]